MVQKIVISGSCRLQFPEIPAKFLKIFTEKSSISIDFEQIFDKMILKIWKITKGMYTFQNFSTSQGSYM